MKISGQLFIFGLCLFRTVCGQEKKLKCNPVNDLEKFSSHDATGVMNGVAEEKVNTAKDPSILCYSKSKPEIHFIKELVVLGGAVHLDFDNAVLSHLYNTTIFCRLHDRESINRSPFPEETVYYKEISGSVTYKCDDVRLQLTLELAGIGLLTKDFGEDPAELGPNRPLKDAQKSKDIEENRGNCVKIGNKSQGPDTEDRDNLGYSCVCSSGACRMMFNENQELVCSLCCPNHYFSTQSYNCEECGGCFTNSNSSVRTSCMYDHNCKRPSTPNELSTITKKHHTSTTIPTSTPGTTTPTSTPGTTTPTSTPSTTTTTSTTGTTTTARNDGSGWTSGAIAGVIVGVIAAVIFGVFVGVIAVVKYREKFPCLNRPLYSRGHTQY